MCDYSLMAVPNRLAREGEELITHRFNTGSMGLASPDEVQNASIPSAVSELAKSPATGLRAAGVRPIAQNDPDREPAEAHAVVEERKRERNRALERAKELLQPLKGVSREALLAGILENSLVSWERSAYDARLYQCDLDEAKLEPLLKAIRQAAGKRLGDVGRLPEGSRKQLRAWDRYRELSKRQHALEKRQDAIWKRRQKIHAEIMRSFDTARSRNNAGEGGDVS